MTLPLTPVELVHAHCWLSVTHHGTGGEERREGGEQLQAVVSPTSVFLFSAQGLHSQVEQVSYVVKCSRLFVYNVCVIYR